MNLRQTNLADGSEPGTSRPAPAARLALVADAGQQRAASPSDADLLQRIGHGDRSAMKIFYDRHQARLHAFIRIRIGDAFEASDILQETFLTVWRNADRFRGASMPRTWLYGIARNKALDRLRRAGRTTLRDMPDDTIPDEAPSPLAVLEAMSDAARLRACIGKLTPAQQSAVRLTFFEDMSYPEAAEVEGVPVGTIKTRIHHAKKLLMHCLTRDVKA